MAQKMRKVEVFDAFSVESGNKLGSGSKEWTRHFLVPVRLERRVSFLAGHWNKDEIAKFERGLPCNLPV